MWYIGNVSDFDFVLAIDASTSMLADDFNSTRLEAAKDASKIFVDSVLENTKIGVVSFASTAFIDKDLTSDKGSIKTIIESLDTREGGGTNIGDTIITSTNMLITEGDPEKTSKVIILLTDGQSNIGAPVDIATDYARNKGVIIHTIGVGTEEGGRFLGLDIITKLDEESLIKIAERTNGRYFRAESKEVLKDAFEEIASFTEKKMSFDISWILLMVSLSLLALEWILTHTVYKTIP